MDNLIASLMKKLESAPLRTQPFRHLIIDDFFPGDILAAILKVALISPVRNSIQLRAALKDEWKVQPFPGCSSSWRSYLLGRLIGLPWRDERVASRGLALRYFGSSAIIAEVQNAMTSEPFTARVKSLMGIDRPIRADSGLQKYLNGYEIAPHSDPHAKAATVLVNLGIDGLRSHGTGTRLFRFREERKYVQSFWKENKGVDPDWVPWDWCEEVCEIDSPNSLLIFCPDETTIHGVRCAYDHRVGQRLQFYGDYWYSDVPAAQPRASYRALDISPDPSLRQRISVYRTNRTA